jgi:tetratricopeptide (TPR) repeat protein
MTTANATVLTDDAAEQTIIDVWSRTSPKYRKRAIVLLIVNVLLFVGLGMFAYWLRTGVNFAPAQEDYWRIVGETFVPRGDANLGNFVIFPIRVDVIPLHGVVVGLLLAAMVSVPIMIAILYRFPCSIPFILIVALVAVMPWLAINITGACVLASVRPFRFRFRYASALLGLSLVMLYFWGASRQAAPPVELYNPADRIKFYAPWILATFASCLIMGLVLFLARVVNYRPGVVAPLLLVCFAVPVLTFEWHVGRDELYYRLLEKRFHEEFGDHDARAWFDQITREVWVQRPEPKPTLEVFRDQVDLRLALELDSASDMRSTVAQQTEDFIEACKDFVRAFPDSRYAPNLLYLQGQAQDARIDVDVFEERKLLRFYFDFPVSTPRAKRVWEKVVYNAPDSSISAVGRYKLALIHARAGGLPLAIELLDDLITHYDSRRQASDGGTALQSGPVQRALASAPPDASLNIRVDDVMFSARRLRKLFAHNGNDAHYGLRPLCGSQAGEPRQPGFLQLDAHTWHYPNNLRSLLEAYPDSLLADNIKLALAMTAETADERIDQLQACIERHPGGDARPEALYKLGVACFEAGMDARARRSLALVLKEYPDSLWADPANKRLRALPPPDVETLP